MSTQSTQKHDSCRLRALKNVFHVLRMKICFLEFVRFCSTNIDFGASKYIVATMRQCMLYLYISSMTAKNKQKHRSCRLRPLKARFHVFLKNFKKSEFWRSDSKMVDFTANQRYGFKLSSTYVRHFCFTRKHSQRPKTLFDMFGSIRDYFPCRIKDLKVFEIFEILQENFFLKKSL